MRSSATSPRGRRILMRAARGGALIAAGAAVAWAALTVLRPPEDPSVASPFTHVEVTAGEVAADLSLTATAAWPTTPVGHNRAQGIVTEIAVAAGEEVFPGSRLYSVGERPVIIAEGPVPMYRTIAERASGADVEQLQQLLAALGHYDGPMTGTADPATVSAISAWQSALGVGTSGAVEVADVVFVPRLPTRVLLDAETITRGATLAGGEAVVLGLPETPSFSISVTDSQAAMMPAGTRVELTSPVGSRWEAFVTEAVSDPETATVSVQLTGDGDTPICAEACAEVPVPGPARLPSRIVTVEAVSGLVVPSAALVTEADGSIGVVDRDGTVLPVRVRAQARGMSVIDGVTAGISVRVPGDAGDPP